MLGEKIKLRRKELQMTQTDLAGAKLTKGMISLIENNKSYPSMDTLLYIAAQLEVDINQLLEKGDAAITDTLFADIAASRKKFLTGINDGILEIVEPHINEIQENLKGAYIYSEYAATLFLVKGKNEAEQYFRKAYEIYKRENDLTHSLLMEIALVTINFDSDSHTAQKLIDIYENYKDNHLIDNPNIIPDLLSNIGAIYLEDNFERSLEYLNLAESAALERGIFKVLTRIYKHRGIIYAMRNGKEELTQELENLKRIEHLFKSQKNSIIYRADLASLAIIDAMLTNNFDKVLTTIEIYNTELLKMDITKEEKNNYSISFEHLFKGIAYYELKQYKKAENELNKVMASSFPKNMHPYDVSLTAQLYSYKALNAKRLGNNDEAKLLAEQGWMIVKHLKENIYRNKVREIYEELLR